MIQTNMMYVTRALGTVGLSAAILFGGIMNSAAQSYGRDVRLDTGSVIPVDLNTSLSSRTAHRGDPFTATVRSDEARDYNLPDGTRVDGVVEMARPHTGNDPGVLDLSFRRLRLPDGRSYPIEGSLIGLDNKSVDRRSDGRLVATPDHTNKKLMYAGYGAGAGLILGVLTKHTLEDTLLGGGLGYLFGSLDKSHAQARDVNLKPGTEIGVRLDRSVDLASYNGDSDRNGESYQNNDTYRNDGRYHNTEDSGRFHRNTTNRDNYAPGGPGSIGVLVGQNSVNFSSNAQPVWSHATVMVPVRPVLHQAGIPFSYSSSGRYIRATGDGGTVRLALDSSIAVVNGSRRVWLGAPAQMLNGTVYVPMKFFSLVTGRPASYDSGSRTVVLDMPQMQEEDNNR